NVYRIPTRQMCAAPRAILDLVVLAKNYLKLGIRELKTFINAAKLHCEHHSAIANTIYKDRRPSFSGNMVMSLKSKAALLHCFHLPLQLRKRSSFTNSTKDADSLPVRRPKTPRRSPAEYTVNALLRHEVAPEEWS